MRRLLSLLPAAQVEVSPGGIPAATPKGRAQPAARPPEYCRSGAADGTIHCKRMFMVKSYVFRSKTRGLEQKELLVREPLQV